MRDRLPDEVAGALQRMGVLRSAHAPLAERLTGGVSSDIWRVDLPLGSVCVKRALTRLRVAADWRAPPERNLYEARWMRHAAAAAPGAAPALLGHDAATGTLAMEYLPPATHPLWKPLLRDGVADPAFAAKVGRTLARIHAASAADPAVATEFASDAIFHAIRLEPYLLATAAVHPNVAGPLRALAATTARTKRALVHGDVSPKNILVGPRGPVFLDAECAWWGDPAFDLAFCLNHLLLKCVWTRGARGGFLACFDAMARAYLAGVAWEEPGGLEARAARLLPGLLLARVDGKSPVEYITTEDQRNRVRGVGRALLAEPVDRLGAVRAAWDQALARGEGG
jgi:aminoglycoside phosphotransferase (APT) family kinase protein